MAFPPSYPPTSAPRVPCSRVVLHLSCSKLRDADLFSKSDPLVALCTYHKPTNSWTEYARTERISNSVNPQFTRAIELDYCFEQVQRLKFSVYDLDNDTPSLGDDDFLGCLECSLGEVVSVGTYTKPLTPGTGKKSKGNLGTMTVRAEQVSENKSMLELRFSAQGLDKKDFLGKSDPYLEFASEAPDGKFSVVHRTEVIKNTLNPTWPRFEISSNTLCNSVPGRRIQVRCYDWDSDGSHDFIGEFPTTLAEFIDAYQNKKQLQWELINPAKKSKKKNYKNSGTVYLESIKITHLYSFLEYIMGGCQIHFTVGVDFTGSNGDPRQPSSLHYIDPHRPNEYTRALVAVGSVCQDYDTDKLFPALGFGAKVEGKVSHEFALNGNPHNPYCVGIPGVVQAYQSALQSVELWGPTNVAPIINHVARFAEQAATKQDAQNYFVLLLLTDGALSDMADTKAAVVRASRLPMSVIIVGVGGADFSAMRELDADEERLRAVNGVAERDIVQFVPFRKFAQATPEALASAVLAEVPGQLVEYMRNRGISPLNVPVQQPL